MLNATERNLQLPHKLGPAAAERLVPTMGTDIMGRTALVTGGTRGIGAAIATALRDAGYTVVASYHGNDSAAEEFRAATGIPVFKWDVADDEACAAAVAKITSAFGPVEILVNNAGITRDAMLHKLTSEHWRAVIDTDLTACFTMCRTVISPMRERGYGRIINISSINGQKGQLGQTNYAAAKAGLLGFTKALALESAAKGVTVNAIAPGYIETDMVADVSPKVLDSIVAQIPVGRLGTSEDIASLVTFLCSERAGFLAATNINSDGGAAAGLL